MVFVYQTGGKIPKEIIHNGLVYRHEWNAESMDEAKRIKCTRLSVIKDKKALIKKIPYARETVYAVYFHISTTDRIIGGKRYTMMGSAPTKSKAKEIVQHIYKGAGYRVIHDPPGYGFWVPFKGRKK